MAKKRSGRHYAPGLVPGQPAAGHKPFASKAQARLFFRKLSTDSVNW
jgi:hypothetical protein